MDARFSLTLVIVIGLAVGLGLLVAHGQPQTVAAPAPGITPTPLPAPLPHHVDIVSTGSGGAYDPPTQTVHVGQTVTWVNLASSNQTATADNGAFDSGVLSPRQFFRWKPRKPGRYPYSSFIDPTERGLIIVKP